MYQKKLYTSIFQIQLALVGALLGYKGLAIVPCHPVIEPPHAITKLNYE